MPVAEKAVAWRKAFKAELKKQSEDGLMLRGSRAKEEISQADLAKALGVSQHRVSEMESSRLERKWRMERKWRNGLLGTPI